MIAPALAAAWAPVRRCASANRVLAISPGARKKRASTMSAPAAPRSARTFVSTTALSTRGATSASPLAGP